MESLLKQRELVFSEPHTDKNQARSAMLLLMEVPGIDDIILLSSTRLLVTYHLRQINLLTIHEALQLVGFHLDNNLLTKLKNALYYYCEETQSENLGIKGTKATKHLFINRYQQLPHGCRDDRPEHWRKYL